MANTESNDIITIAVMGATGVGKTTFINRASGSDLEEGGSLDSCTSEITRSKIFTMNGRRVQLIDTPGFDDSTTPDTQILRRIALYLETEYSKGYRLNGVLYLHRISDIRMGGVARRNFSMFRKLCGEGGLKNVSIVTTRWSDVPPDVGARREEQLKTQNTLFRPVLEAGASMYRHDNTRESTLRVLEPLVGSEPVTLQIQNELVDLKKDIADTGAGVELQEAMKMREVGFLQEIESLRTEMKEALAQKDVDAAQELSKFKQEYEEKLASTVESRERLSARYAEDKRAMEQKIRELEVARTADERKHEEERQRLGSQMASMKQSEKALVASHSVEKTSLQQKLNKLKDDSAQTKKALEEEKAAREAERREAQEKAEKWEKERIEREKELEVMRAREEARELEREKERNEIRERELKWEKERLQDEERREREKSEAVETERRAREIEREEKKKRELEQRRREREQERKEAREREERRAREAAAEQAKKPQEDPGHLFRVIAGAVSWVLGR